MRKDTHYDLVFEIRFPLDESSHVARESWAFGLSEKLKSIPLNKRLVRTGEDLQVLVQVDDFRMLGPAFSMVLRILAPQSRENIAVTVHEREMAESPEPQTIPIEEMV